MNAHQQKNRHSVADALLQRIDDKSARIVVAGMGYVGLALAVELAHAGFQVTGLDIDADRVDRINRGEADVVVKSEGSLSRLTASRQLRATVDQQVLREADCISICVPTPLNKTKDPDVSYILDITRSIRQYIHRGQLVILESTTYPGTTRELILPLLSESGLVAGRDFFLCFSPERVDPGNPRFGIRNTPKVVGGITPACTQAASRLYRHIADSVISVSSTESAEMTKLLENTFRIVNIGLVNEVAIMCQKLNIDVWEVIDTAATKPFGYMKFQPGPGLGGHCIPVDPHYLSWKLRSLNYKARFIELAGEVNSEMPEVVVQKVADGLNQRRKSINGARILLLGLAYKRDVEDMRESPALDIFSLLQARGAKMLYADPYIPAADIGGHRYRSRSLTPRLMQSVDCVVVATDHQCVDYRMVAKHAPLIVDSRNALRGIRSGKIIRL